MRYKLDLGQVDEGSVDGVRLMTSKVSFLMTCCRGEVFFNIHIYTLSSMPIDQVSLSHIIECDLYNNSKLDLT